MPLVSMVAPVSLPSILPPVLCPVVGQCVLGIEVARCDGYVHRFAHHHFAVVDRAGRSRRQLWRAAAEIEYQAGAQACAVQHRALDVSGVQCADRSPRQSCVGPERNPPRSDGSLATSRSLSRCRRPESLRCHCWTARPCADRRFNPRQGVDEHVDVLATPHQARTH